jgi:hypothetical protein
VNVVCSQVEISVMGQSLVQRSPTDCDLYKSTATVRPKKVGLFLADNLARHLLQFA